MICACCGSPIEGKVYGPYKTLSGHMDYVCERCWNDPTLSFPDKLPDFLFPSLSDNLNYISSLVPKLFPSLMSSRTLDINAVKLIQGNVTLYIGTMKAIEILALYDLRRWNELTQDGYQRELYRERKKEIANFLKKCPIPIIPTIFVSIRENTEFIPINDSGVGTLKLPKKEGSIILIDGQHRMSGFQVYVDEIANFASENNSKTIAPEIEKAAKILNYDIPVLFLDSKTASDFLLEEKEIRDYDLSNDVERAIFYIVNKTQKGMNPSLKDTLQYLIFKSRIRGIPTIEKEQWRVEAAELGHILTKKNYPLEKLINLSGVRGAGKPLKLNSWISSLEPLFALDIFKKLDFKSKLSYIRVYWSIIKRIFPDAFTNFKDHLLLKSIGVYSINWLAANIYEWCVVKDEDFFSEEIISYFLSPLKNFNWKTKEPGPSPLKGLGGKTGVREAYKILLENMAEKGIVEAKEKLNQLNFQ